MEFETDEVSLSLSSMRSGGELSKLRLPGLHEYDGSDCTVNEAPANAESFVGGTDCKRSGAPANAEDSTGGSDCIELEAPANAEGSKSEFGACNFL